MKRYKIEVDYNLNKDKGKRWTVAKGTEYVSSKRVVAKAVAWIAVVGIIGWMIIK